MLLALAVFLFLTCLFFLIRLALFGFRFFFLAFPRSTGKSKLFCIEFECFVGTDPACVGDEKVKKIKVNIKNNKGRISVFEVMIK